MSFGVTLSLANLIFYSTQQFGVMLGVGAETVLLVAYLQSMRDGTVDEEEKGFARATRRVMDVGLFLIVVSGIGIIAVQFMGGQSLGLFSTTFLFKWSLIGIVLFMSLLNRGTSLTAGLLQGLAAGTWYALFVVHILAPDAGWLQLGTFYAVWLVGFVLCWTVVVFSFRGKPQMQKAKETPPSVAKPAVVIQPTPVAVPAPKTAPATPIASQTPKSPPTPITSPVLPKPTAPVSPVPSPASAVPLGLHTMPKTPEELAQRQALNV